MKDDSQFKAQAKLVAAAVSQVPLRTEAIDFPWSFYLVDVTLLLGHLKQPFDHHFEAIRALRNSLDGPFETEVNIVPDSDVAAETVSDNDVSTKAVPVVTADPFITAIRALTSEQRRKSCVYCCAGVVVCNDRALRRDSNPESAVTMFPDDPFGWIRNGLWCIEVDTLGSLKDGAHINFVECRALAFSSSFGGPGAMAASASPMLYVGTGSWRRDIDRWRAGFWYRDIRHGYDLKGQELRDYWLKMVPGASEPDPVFRFLASPSAELKTEAELFMRQVVANGAPRHQDPNERPIQFKHGPCRCSRAELNLSLSGSDRQNILKDSLWSLQNPHGTIWLNPNTPLKSRKCEFYFLTHDDYAKAESGKSK